jgi:3-keto-disaccharide hydrolase/Domain of unknown function (DUF3471)
MRHAVPRAATPSTRYRLAIAALVSAGLLVCLGSPGARAQSPAEWKAHDMNRPRPAMVKSSLALPVPAPSDAVVLFDGRDLSNWRDRDGGSSKWVVKDGYMESVKGSGYLFSRDSFGDIQLHVEWAAPLPAEGIGQGRGNSGVFLMGLYEIQVLDSYDNFTYADGQAGAVYGQHPPLANASRPAGEWQSYDIVFRHPRFHRDGHLLQPARVTVFHNGILVQDNAEIWGATAWLKYYPYESQPDRLPLALQDHGNPVRYRNIWLRELAERTEPGPTSPETTVIPMTTEALDRYTGKYKAASGREIVIRREGSRLFAFVLARPNLELLPHSKQEFMLRWTDARLVFDLNADDAPTAVTFYVGRAKTPAKKVE